MLLELGAASFMSCDRGEVEGRFARFFDQLPEMIGDTRLMTNLSAKIVASPFAYQCLMSSNPVARTAH